MKTLIGVPVGLIIYVISVVSILAFCLWSFEKPQEWQTAIPIITSLFSITIANFVAEDKFSKASGAVVSWIVAAFWIAFVVIDIKGDIQDIIGFFQGKTPTMDEMDIVMFYVDGVLNAKIFAVVSGLWAFGSTK